MLKRYPRVTKTRNNQSNLFCYQLSPCNYLHTLAAEQLLFKGRAARINVAICQLRLRTQRLLDSRVHLIHFFLPQTVQPLHRIRAPVTSQKNKALLSTSVIIIIIRCASGRLVECQICNREVAGSNLSQGYFAPRSTQPSIPQRSVNEYQLRLGRQRQVWLIPIADERVGVQVKL